MALSIVGGTGYQHGIEAAETGGNVASFSVRYFPEINKRNPGITGESTIRVVSTKFSREVKLSGEVTGSTGVMAFGLAASCSVANDVADYGDGSGTLLLDEATVSQSRDGFRSFDISLSSNPLVVAA